MVFSSDRQYIGTGPGVASSFGSLDFDGVTIRIFPLRANLSRLETFCNNYLNVAPAEMACFHPVTPYVFLMVINYGRMAGQASNMGWVAQNEILFSVPVQGRWHQADDVVEDFATVSPYIWVDNAWSITTGREVFGWPKMMAWHSAGPNQWMRDPSRRRGLLEMKTLLFADDYSGQEIRPRTLLRIEQDTPRFLTQFPPDPAHLAEPLVQASKLLFHAINTAPDTIRGLTRLARTGGAATLGRQIRDLLRNLQGETGNLYGNTINLKQFRSSTPRAACYQSLTNSKMVFRRYLKGGLLGAFDQLLGDPTAGTSIFVHRYPTYPIIESLGLEVEDEVQVGAASVAELKPLFPFWISVDMRYELGQRLCWRTQETDWCVGTQRDALPMLRMSSPQVTTATPFNTTLGPMIGAMEGPFDFYDATMRVLPLKAKSSALRRLLPPIDEQIKALWNDDRWRDSSWEPYPITDEVPGRLPKLADDYDSWVFLTVSNFGSMAADVNDIGWWAKSDVSIAILTRVELAPPTRGRRRHAGKELFFLYWPFVFADSPLAVTEGREVTGLPTAYAQIDAGNDAWLEAVNLDAPRTVLDLITRDYPALGVGQEGEHRRLFEIVRTSRVSTSSNLVERLIENKELYSRVRDGLRYYNLSLKQFRDEEDPNLICYRALQAWDRMLGRWVTKSDSRDGLEIEPLRGEYRVEVHASPSFRLVEALGLEVKEWKQRAGSQLVASCEVHNPFWLTMDMRAALPVPLAEQSVDSHWRSTPEGVAFLSEILRRRFQEAIPVGVEEEPHISLGELIEEFRPALGPRP